MYWMNTASQKIAKPRTITVIITVEILTKMAIQMSANNMLEIDFEDWDYLDEEDICSAYIDTRKRFLCGDEDNNGANSDCWTISSQNEATVHFLTDSFRIKITKPALKFIAESIKHHDRQYKQQQFRKKQRNRSLCYPSLGVLKAKREQLDKETNKNKHMRRLNDPDFLPNEKEKQQKQKDGLNYSSMGHNHAMKEVAPPHQDAANFRQGNPNIPHDVEDTLEESLSVSEEDFDMVNSLGDKALNLFTAPPPFTITAPPIHMDKATAPRTTVVTQNGHKSPIHAAMTASAASAIHVKPQAIALKEDIVTKTDTRNSIHSRPSRLPRVLDDVN
eukprot:758268_1